MERKNRIYLDNAATTFVFEEILNQMPEIFTELYANPNSIYSDAQVARQIIEKSRENISDIIGVSPDEIIFTSCATESNNTVIRGLAERYPEKKKVLISPIEHKSVLNPARFLSKRGFNVELLKMDRNGIVDIDDLKRRIDKDTLFVSVIHGNNETGVLQDINQIGRICKEKGVFFFSDTVQSFMREEIDPNFTDFFSVSGHKIGTPKGVGLLYKRKDIKIEPLLFGGGQERGLRSGTENTQFIKFLSDAVKIWDKERGKFLKKLVELRDYFERRIKEEVPEVIIVSEGVKRLPHISCVILPYIDAQTVIISLDRKGIAVSSGSACSSGTPEPSHVLLSYGYTDKEALRAVRISFSFRNSKEEIETVVREIKNLIDNYKTFMSTF